ncbi:MAG: DUF3795 domain-containing protein [Elusimicrobia bacterium]|nr:DUF3795 domain-containing protein [Elusimicrobiota bacterium]
MTKRRVEVGACGNFCAGCPDFEVLVKNDDSFRRQVAETLTKETGRHVSPEEVGCEGCWGKIHNDLAASLKCRIRQCVEAKGFATCAECGDFPCPMYLKQFPEDSQHGQNIRAIRNDGLDKWIAKQ